MWAFAGRLRARPVLAVAVGILVFANAARAAGPITQPDAKATTQADPKVVADLVGQLNHKDFNVREAATKKLIELGESVRSMLEAELKKPDPDPPRGTFAKATLVVLPEMIAWSRR